MKTLGFLIAVALVWGAIGNANAELIVNPDGTVTQTNFGDPPLMWLLDANYAKTSGYDGTGQMTWQEALDWADQLVFAGHGDWRLPSAFNLDGSGPGYGYNVTESELGHLYYIELGNIGEIGGFTNSGPFINVQWQYWFGTPSQWVIQFNSPGMAGYQHVHDTGECYAWAVRRSDPSEPGPVEPVPEPGTMLLVGSGIAALMAFKRKFIK